MSQQEQKELEIQNELLKVIAEQNHEKIFEYRADTDHAMIYTVANGQFVPLYDLPGYIAEKKCGNVFIDPEDRQNYQKAIHKCLKKKTHTIIDAQFIEEGKKPEWHRFYLVSVIGEDKQVERIVGRIISIHNEKLVNDGIRRRAEIDALTNVYNHKAFEELCTKEIAKCKGNALFFMLDVDDFKLINDTQGHGVGDMVLSQTGEVLNAAVGEHGIAGRLGGDEFAALVWNLNDAGQIREFCQKLHKDLKSIIFDLEYSASIGATMLKGRDLSFHDLYFEADQAVYAAKRSGKNQVVFYEDIEEGCNQEEQVTEQVEQVLAEADERQLLRELRECLKYLSDSDFRESLQQALHSLLEYFDADCVGVVYRKENKFRYVEECHKETAHVMARLVRESVENGKTDSFLKELDKAEDIVIPKVKSIRETRPELYLKLAECRIWALAETALRESDQLIGSLFVLNPHKNMEIAPLLSMVGGIITEKILRQNLLELQEYEHTHDHLTDLWNRDSYTAWFRDNKDIQYDSIGVITTDVIHLSEINQQFGYRNGNKRLAEVADLLKSMFDSYQIFRYDGDEMLVLCLNIHRYDMELMADCLREKLEELGFAVAMGYAWSAHPNIQNLITEAEVVMDNDKLKLLHGSTVSMRMKQTVIDEVNHFIQTGRYLVYLQPKVHIRTGRTEGAEALVRQMDDALGIVGPGMFIPVLERYNLIHMVDLYVLEEVFRYQQEQFEKGRRTVPISVNFSKKTIIYPELVEQVKRLTMQYRVPTELIHIEVTETVGDMDHVLVENVANSLKTLGFCLSMDDFGSHYSNLAVLIQYDFDSAKIDRSMVTEITSNQKSRILLDYMTSMIDELGIECIVEGIETREQVDILKETKADMIQGFYFGKPVPKEEFYDMFIEEEHKEMNTI